MTCAVIIPSLAFKNEDYLELCVTSLRESGITWDIIVVTNGASAPPKFNFRGITRHLHIKDQGQGRAVNIGVSTLPTDINYFMVANDDMYFAPGWDKNLRFGFDCFSPNLVEPTNNHGSAPPFMKFNGGFTLEEFKKEAIDKFIKKEVNKEYSPQDKNETGFNLPFFIKKKLWDCVGGYDEAYDPWGASSDTDLQMKIELAGVIPMRLRDVLVYHFSNKSGTFDFSEPERQAFWQNNWEYLQDKWGFNRDEAGSDTWYHRNMIMYDKLKYHPEWEGKYGKTT